MQDDFDCGSYGAPQTPEPEKIPARKQMWRAYNRYFLALLAYFLVSYGLIFILQAVFRGQSFTESIYWTYFLNVVPPYIFGFGALYLIVRTMPKSARKTEDIKGTSFLSYLCLCFTATIVGSFVSNIVIFIAESIRGEAVTDTTSELINETPVWLIVAVVVCIGPVVEEFLFRKLLLDRLSVYGERTALTVSGVAFGLFHGNFFQFFYAALLGIILGHLYLRTRKIRYNILLHALFNLFGSVIALYCSDQLAVLQQEFEKMAAGEPVNTAAMGIASLIVSAYVMLEYGLALAGLIILCVRRNSVIPPDRCEIAVPPADRAVSAAVNPGVLLFVCFSAFLMTVSLMF